VTKDGCRRQCCRICSHDCLQRLFRAQLHHDRKHYDERSQLPEAKRAQTPWVDYLRPIIADADTG
jgi:isocitrate lyase